MRWGRATIGAVLCVLLPLTAAAPVAAAPRAVLTEAPPAETTDTAARFAFGASEPTLIGAFQCRIDGGPWEVCTSPVELGDVTGGAHRFEVRLVGLLTDPAVAVHDWAVTVPTVALPPPLPPPPSAGPDPRPPRPASRRDRRRRFVADGCAYGAARPGQVAPVLLERATVCLVNRARARAGVAALRRSALLTSSARRHARDMVRRRYFAHTSPGGRTFGQRIAASPWVRTPVWAAGEVLAWARPDPTPRRQVRNLLASAPHRAILLGPAWHEVGFGVARGAPRRGRTRAATVVGHFGRTG